MFSTLHIELGHDNFDLEFRLLDSPITELWIERMQSRQSYTLDDPKRFYGFNSQAEEITIATKMITRCIDIINAHQLIIHRPFTDVHDQDCLNYLHNIFERYHGLLDQQNHDFWQRAPDEVRKALADLNIFVHRCESVKNARPRHVVTYFGLPKTKTLQPEDFNYFEDQYQFGTVYLNYVEIGKTLEDLAQDNDQYIGDDAFKQFNYYSADFNVKFWNDDARQIESKRAIIKQYYDSHAEFFVA
jgi:hypothetical protein